ncbi:hypothetical protein CsSME_00013658 [Camellia sinensis var. sinensis]
MAAIFSHSHFSSSVRSSESTSLSHPSSLSLHTFRQSLTFSGVSVPSPANLQAIRRQISCQVSSATSSPSFSVDGNKGTNFFLIFSPEFCRFSNLFGVSELNRTRIQGLSIGGRGKIKEMTRSVLCEIFKSSALLDAS